MLSPVHRGTSIAPESIWKRLQFVRHVPEDVSHIQRQSRLQGCEVEYIASHFFQQLLPLSVVL
jgi:predicted  nucleic acid-binding Zn ribbon protein